MPIWVDENRFPLGGDWVHPDDPDFIQKEDRTLVHSFIGGTKPMTVMTATRSYTDTLYSSGTFSSILTYVGVSIEHTSTFPMVSVFSGTMRTHLIFRFDTTSVWTIPLLPITHEKEFSMMSATVPGSNSSFWKMHQFNPGVLPHLPDVYSDLLVYDIFSGHPTVSREAIHFERTDATVFSDDVYETFKNVVNTDYYTTAITSGVDFCANDGEPPFITLHSPAVSGIHLREQDQIVDFSLGDAVAGVLLTSVDISLIGSELGQVVLVTSGVDQTGGDVAITGNALNYRFTYIPPTPWEFNESVVVTISGADIPLYLSPLCGGIETNAESAHFERASSQHASVADTALFDVSAMTIECWIRPDDLPSTGAILGKIGAASGNYSFWFRTVGTTDIQVAFSTTGTSSGQNITQAHGVTLLNTWHHVAATWDGSTGDTIIYVDGVALAAPVTLLTGTLHDSSAAFAVGRLGDHPELSDTAMSEVRIWDVVRTPTEIQDNMLRVSAGNESGLLVAYHLDGNFDDAGPNELHLTAVNSPTFITNILGSPVFGQYSLSDSNHFIGDIPFQVLNRTDVSAEITAIGDIDAPYLQYEYPPSGTVANTVFTDVSFSVIDDLTGVDLSSIVVSVDGIAVVNNGLPVTSETTLSASGVNYVVNHNPTTSFSYGSTVQVSVTAKDRALPTANVLTTSYDFTCITDSTLVIDNFQPGVGTHVDLANIDIIVDVTDDTYGVDTDQTFFVINGTIVSGTQNVLASGVQLTYHPPNDFAFNEPVRVTVHGTNNNTSAPVVKEAFYTLFYGCRVLLVNQEPYSYADRVDVFVRARNNEQLHRDLSTGYFFTTYTQPQADIGASIEAINPEVDLPATLNVLGPEHRYGETVTVEFSVEDFDGRLLGPYTYTYTIENRPE